jgi:hypothetical protein
VIEAQSSRKLGNIIHAIDRDERRALGNSRLDGKGVLFTPDHCVNSR